MNKKLITIAMLVVMAIGMAQADEHRHTRREHHNYIIERQEAYQVQGVPTERMIIGKREIDIYRAPDGNGHIMFEGDHMIGVTR